MTKETATPEAFRGVIQLYGERQFDRFQRARILVVGLGGVGSWVVEGLARSGIGFLDLCDLDDICVNNINRQLQALPSTVGQSKVRVLANRVGTIAPTCQVKVVEDFFTKESISMLDELSQHEGDALVIDAIDSLENKALLVEGCLQRSLPILCSGAAGGRRDPAQISRGLLSGASVDPLLRNLRRMLRKRYGRDTTNLPGVGAVFSKEVVKPELESCTSQGSEANRKPLARSCDSGMGTAVHVTASIGLQLVASALDHLSVTREG